MKKSELIKTVGADTAFEFVMLSDGIANYMESVPFNKMGNMSKHTLSVIVKGDVFDNETFKNLLQYHTLYCVDLFKITQPMFQNLYTKQLNNK